MTENRYYPKSGDIRLAKDRNEAWLYIGGHMWQVSQPPTSENWKKRHRLVGQDRTYTYWRKSSNQS